MSWRDFFYFSKGERSGLIVLLCLITIAGILLILNNKPPVSNPGLQQTSVGDVREPSDDKLLSVESPVVDNSRTPASVSGSDSERPAATRVSGNDKNTSGSGKLATAEKETMPANKKESVSERVDRLTSYARPSYPRVEKFKEGTIVELNTADTTILKKVPGIGSSFAKRIVSYRNLLGGYYSITQLSEVYGVDEDRYNAFVPWFSADPSLISKLSVNTLSQDSLRRHPYINYGQARIITQLRKQKGKLTGWENLQLLNEFADADKIRLQHYLSFE